jgi:4'-phosphopantetheinyl transferase
MLPKIGHKAVNRLISYLPIAEEERIGRYVQPKDRLRSLAANMLARIVICRERRDLKGRLRFSRNVYGKPYVLDESIHFNVSHSGDWVVCALDDSPIGIDIERELPIDLQIAEKHYSSAEYANMMSRPVDERLACFYQLWTLKESYVKAIGKGLSIPLHQFTIHVGEASICLTGNGHRHEGSPYFRTYRIDPDYVMSVCSASEMLPDQVTIIPWDRLQDEFVQVQAAWESSEKGGS